jgi:hypothetical protein
MDSQCCQPNASLKTPLHHAIEQVTLFEKTAGGRISGKERCVTRTGTGIGRISFTAIRIGTGCR